MRCAPRWRPGRRRRAGHEPLRLRRRAASATATRRASPSTASARQPIARAAASCRSTCPECCASAGARADGRRRALPVAAGPARSTRICCRRARRCVLTAHDVLPREPRAGPARRAAAALRPRRRRRRPLRARPPRGSSTSSASTERACPRRSRTACSTHLARRRSCAAAGADGARRGAPRGAVLRPAAPLQGPRRAARGLAFRRSTTPSCGSSALPRMDIAALRAVAPPTVRFVPRFVADAEVAGRLPPRRPRRAALPRDRPVRRPVHRARLRHAADPHGCRRLRRGRMARRSSRPATAPRCAARDRRRDRRAAGRPSMPAPHAWDAIARAHLDLYATLVP